MRIIIVPIFLSIFIYGKMEINEPIQPIPLKMDYDREKALLGKKLFFDPGLSSDGTVACANCHQPESGAEPSRFSLGIGQQEGNANAPTVFNSVFNYRQFWNGKSANLADQAKGPMHNPVEMNGSSTRIVSYLNSKKEYRERFEKVYGKSIDEDIVADAIAEFEKALITPNSRFDRYLRGEANLTKSEKRGYRLFKTLGCITCHNGINIGGNSYQKIGLVHRYKWSERSPDRYSLTGREEDKNVYKVPTLRNIELTAPYFHDGSASTIREALEKMAYHNLGLKLREDEVNALSDFLKSLTGQPPDILKEKER
jgi:cytochrome c peroxidase